MNSRSDPNVAGALAPAPAPAPAPARPPTSDIDAQIVLERTRRELREYLLGEPVAANPNPPRRSAKSNSARASAVNHSAANIDSIDWLGLVKAGVSTWWRGHPLHVGAAVLKPVMIDYVKRKPVATLALVAATSAALVLIRPWRMASVTALGMSLVRASNLPLVAASLVATVAENLQKEQP